MAQPLDLKITIKNEVYSPIFPDGGGNAPGRAERRSEGGT
jgi:hypothetical protein